MVDTQLLGDWHGPWGDNETATLRFTAKKSGWIHVVIVPDKADDKTQSYELFASTIGQNHFLNAMDTDIAGHSTESYTFVRYEVRGNHTLQIWMMSQDQAAADVRAGKVKGIVHVNSFPKDSKSSAPDVDVTLTDSTANLNKYLQHSNLDDLFSLEMKPLRRVDAGK